MSHALRRAIRREPPSVIRARLAEWEAAAPFQAVTAPVEAGLRDLERLT